MPDLDLYRGEVCRPAHPTGTLRNDVAASGLSLERPSFYPNPYGSIHMDVIMIKPDLIAYVPVKLVPAGRCAGERSNHRFGIRVADLNSGRCKVCAPLKSSLFIGIDDGRENGLRQFSSRRSLCNYELLVYPFIRIIRVAVIYEKIIPISCFKSCRCGGYGKVLDKLRSGASSNPIYPVYFDRRRHKIDLPAYVSSVDSVIIGNYDRRFPIKRRKSIFCKRRRAPNRRDQHRQRQHNPKFPLHFSFPPPFCILFPVRSSSWTTSPRVLAFTARSMRFL